MEKQGSELSESSKKSVGQKNNSNFGFVNAISKVAGIVVKVKGVIGAILFFYPELPNVLSKLLSTFGVNF